MPDPKTQADYERRFAENSVIEGHGIEGTGMRMPCPFCAAKDWWVYKIISMTDTAEVERTCSECGRSAKVIFYEEDDVKGFRVVQTGGPDPAPYLPPMPREEAA